MTPSKSCLNLVFGEQLHVSPCIAILRLPFALVSPVDREDEEHILPRWHLPSVLVTVPGT